MTNLWQDVRYGLRMLAGSPGFTLVAVMSLALGIGANTAIFSLLDAALLRALPVRDPHGLRVLTWVGDIRPANASYCRLTSTPSGETAANVFTYPAYCDFRDRSAEIADVLAFSDFNQFKPLTVVARGQASTAYGLMVSGNFFRALGIGPQMGQTITAEHDRPQAEPVAVISYAAWERLFGLDPDVIGQTVTLNQNSFTIIGVLPKDFTGLVTGYRSDFYFPMATQPLMRPDCPLESSDHWWVQVMARLAPSVNDQQLAASLDVVFGRMAQQHSANPSPDPLHARVVVEDGSGGPVAPRRYLTGSLSLLMGMVAIILLVACANLAGLLLARGATRQHEMAVRTALGAGRWRLVRQSLTESLLISLMGAGAGLVLASWSKAVLFRLLWPSGVELDLRSSYRVFGFALAASIVAALLSGLFPALRSAGVDPTAGLGGRSTLGGSRTNLGRLLVSIQVALSAVLLIGAGLFARTLMNLYHVETGFGTENLLVFKLDATRAGYREIRLVNFYEQVRTSIAALPGVQAVTHSNLRLLTGWMNNSVARVPGRSAEAGIPFLGLTVGDSFLSTMGIPLLLGRDFDPGDNGDATGVIIVNPTLSRATFGDASPIGRTLTINSCEYLIVGMCGDITYASLKKAFEPTVFYPCRQQAANFAAMHFEIRTSSDPMALVPSIRNAIAGLDRNIPLEDVKTQAIQLEESISRERCLASLASALGLLAVALTCIGLYGLMAYNISRRTREIGLRMAVGARPWDIVKPILREALLLAAMGLILGIPAAFGLAQFVRTVLYGVQPHDPATVAGVVALLTGVAVVAAWVPARRAAKVDPMAALRQE